MVERFHKEAKDAATKDGIVDWELALKNLQMKLEPKADENVLQARDVFTEWLRKFEEAGKTSAFAKAFLSDLKVAPDKVGNEQLEAANKLCARLAKSFGIE